MSYDAIMEKIFTVLISAAVGWLISAATKVSNTRLEQTITELEKRVISPLVLRLERLESKAEGFATRSDVKEIVLDLKAAMEARQVEIRGTMNGISRELREIDRGWWVSALQRTVDGRDMDRREQALYNAAGDADLGQLCARGYVCDQGAVLDG